MTDPHKSDKKPTDADRAPDGQRDRKPNTPPQRSSKPKRKPKRDRHSIPDGET